MKSNELSILVYSCNKNRDMWTIFLSLFRRYWNDCKYKLILLTDYYEDEKSVEGFDDVVTLDDSWYNMIMAGIERAATPYVMLFMDDYLLCDYVNNQDIDNYIEIAKKYNCGNIRFFYSNMLKPKTFKRDDRFNFFKPGSAYSITTQVGIWDVEFMKRNINPDWSAWDFERVGSVEIKDSKQPLLGTKNYVFPYIEGIRKGKWMPQGQDLCHRVGIDIDSGKRGFVSNFEMAWIYFKGGLMGINPTLVQKIQNIINKR